VREPAPRPVKSLMDRGRRDALFQAYLHWQDQQTRREGLIRKSLQGDEQRAKD
jgi:hypothetical protein